MKTIIIGLGNPILGDDGVGWHVAETVRQLIETRGLSSAEVVVDWLSVGGLELMEHLIDYNRTILIDSINLGNEPTGTVYSFALDELANAGLGHTSSAHDTTLQNAIIIGEKLGAQLPTQIHVIAIESPNVYNFSEHLTDVVARAVPYAAQAVMDILANKILPFRIHLTNYEPLPGG